MFDSSIICLLIAIFAGNKTCEGDPLIIGKKTPTVSLAGRKKAAGTTRFTWPAMTTMTVSWISMQKK